MFNMFTYFHLTSAVFISVLIQVCLHIFWLISDNYLEEELPVLLWWTPFIPYQEIIECADRKYKCIVTSNKTIKPKVDAYLFYGSQIQNYDFPLPRNQNIPWAIFHEESPRNYAPLLYGETQSLFNITSTFSQKSDFPITMQYLSSTEFDLLTDMKYYLSVHLKNGYLDSISPVLYIQSQCDTPIGRDSLVSELSKYVKIDSYGNCLKNKDFPIELKYMDPLDLYNDKYLQFIARYKFIVAFENSICEDYITEKLWRPLIVGAIPIYVGSPTVKKWLPNPNSAIILTDFENIKALATFIHTVNNDDKLYNSFLEHKIFSNISNEFLKEHVISEDSVEAFQCFLCETIHGGIVKGKSVENFYNCPRSSVSNKTTWHQHWEIGKCQSKALKVLIEKNVPYASEDFEKLWKQFLVEGKC